MVVDAMKGLMCMAASKLPNDFFLGAAMSGPQTEGAWQRFGKIENLWET